MGTGIEGDVKTLLRGAVSGEVRAVLEKRGVVIFRDGNFSDADMVSFAKSLGNVRSFYWHMDETYADVPPLATVLTPRALSTTGVGMDEADSRALLQEPTEWTAQSRFVYQHHWRMGNLLIWDNTGTMHRALPYAADSGRKLYRVTLDGEESLAA